MDFHVRRAKNDQHGLGRSAVIGNAIGDGSNVRELLDEWLALLAPLRVEGCIREHDRKGQCTACGWLLPRLAGNPPRLTRDRRKFDSTTNFLADDIRQALRQLQHLRHPDIPMEDVKHFVTVALRRGGNSAAAARGITSAIRQVQGRWRGEETHDQHYLELHRHEFTSMGHTLIMGDCDGGAPSVRAGNE